jgi:hypothetical protein
MKIIDINRESPLSTDQSLSLTMCPHAEQIRRIELSARDLPS